MHACVVNKGPARLQARPFNLREIKVIRDLNPETLAGSYALTAWSPGAAVSSQIWRAPLLHISTYRSNVKLLYHICLQQHLPVEHQLASSYVSGAHVQGPKLTLSCMAVHAQCQGPQASTSVAAQGPWPTGGLPSNASHAGTSAMWKMTVATSRSRSSAPPAAKSSPCASCTTGQHSKTSRLLRCRCEAAHAT